MGHLSLYHDKALFEAIVAGNEAAFETLFHRYKSNVYGSAFKWTRSAHASEEITQEVFIRLWTGRHNLASVQEPLAYIYRMVSNKVKDYLQSDSNRETILRKVREEQPAFSIITEETIQLNNTSQLLNEAMQQLSQQKRKVYAMNRQEGKSIHEIAEELQLSPNTVKTHLYDALHTLRRYLKNAGTFLFILGSQLFQ
jgi:RNA polymerase sigma-70 factor (ECF subfamily)